MSSNNEEKTPLVMSSNNNKKFTSNNKDDDSIKDLLTSLEKDPRYAEQAHAVSQSLNSTSSPRESATGGGGGFAPSLPGTEPYAYDTSGTIENTVAADVAAATNWNIDQCSSWTPYSNTGVPFGVVVYNPHPFQVESSSYKCHFCDKPQTSKDDPIFKPCKCKICHRSCFKKWRQGWINPRNYWNCPECMTNYKLERIAQSDYKTSDDVRREIRCKIGQLWAAIVLTLAAAVSILATIAWAADRDNKNVPVFIKSVLTSVVYGFPNVNSTRDWREEFKDPEVHVLQYYHN